MMDDAVEIWTCFACGRGALIDDQHHECPRTYPFVMVAEVLLHDDKPASATIPDNEIRNHR